MADRAVGKGDPGVPREVFELDKDERWQARLEDARARREIALREKAAGKPQPKRPKPWEAEGQETSPPIEPIIQERGDEKFDFADRLEQLREADEPRKSAAVAPQKPDAPDMTRATPRPASETVRKHSRPPAGEAIERLRPPSAKLRKLVSRPPVGEVAERRRPPFAKPNGGERNSAVSRRSAPVPSLVIPGAPDVAEIAARYADTLNPGPDVWDAPPPALVVPKPSPAEVPSASDVGEVPYSRRRLRLPSLSTRPGIRPLGMAIGLLALSALPLTTEAPPLEKGPRMPVIAPFAAPPALGVTWSLYNRPAANLTYDWRRKPLPALLAMPEFDPPVTLQHGISALSVPVEQESSGGLPVAADAPPADPVVVPGLGVPETGIAPPRVETEPPADEAAAVPVPGPAPARSEALRRLASEPAYRRPENPLRVTILTPPRADKRVAEELAADVPARGHELVRIREVDQAISERNLRYFHESDRAEAARLARDYDAELRDFTWFRPQPLPGTTELWLSGSAKGPEPATPTPARRRDTPDDLPFVVIRPVSPASDASPGSLLNRVMEGVGNALGTGLGLPRRDN